MSCFNTKFTPAQSGSYRPDACDKAELLALKEEQTDASVNRSQNRRAALRLDAGGTSVSASSGLYLYLSVSAVLARLSYPHRASYTGTGAVLVNVSSRSRQSGTVLLLTRLYSVSSVRSLTALWCSWSIFYDPLKESRLNCLWLLNFNLSEAFSSKTNQG